MPSKHKGNSNCHNVVKKWIQIKFLYFIILLLKFISQLHKGFFFRKTKIELFNMLISILHICGDKY